jgi:predicted DsbA family dithiol-disulfide isomerase
VGVRHPLGGLLLTLVLIATASAEPAPRNNVVRVEHRPADHNPGLGPTTAPVTAELFFVPGQVESNRAYRRLVELQSRHPRRLRVVFRVITRQAQVVVPIAALEAYAQGRFDEFMDAILAARSGTVRREHLAEVAEAAGMEPARLEQAIDRAHDRDQLPDPLRANERRRLRRGANNVPDLLLNGIPVGQPMPGLDVDELEQYYDAAYDAALELLGDGVPEDRIVEQTVLASLPTAGVTEYPAGPVDDLARGEVGPADPPALLASPLELSGLPADGPVDAPVEVVLLCNLKYDTCNKQLDDITHRLRELFPDEVRVVFHPWFDPQVDGNHDAAVLHRAAMCAEQQGAGWTWVEEAVRQVRRQPGDGSMDAIIGKLAELTAVDPDRLDRCLAAGKDADVIARVGGAIASGVTHAPAVVVGGRVFLGGFTDWRAVAPLVEVELAPGLLGRAVPDWAVR